MAAGTVDDRGRGGGAACYLLRAIDNCQTELLITLALVAGGYALAHALGVSGTIAMMVAGLLTSWLLAGAAVIVIVLFARFVSVSLPAFVMGRPRVLPYRWGALRGGIAVALALSIPSGDLCNILLTMTYVVVVFSILVQGLTIGPLVRRFSRHGVAG